MPAHGGSVPPGPVENFNSSHNLLEWLSEQFQRYGDIYQARIYGTTAYVVSDPSYAQRILRDNARNYKKGQAIKRVGLLLGNGLMVSEGEFWKAQRRMIQPAFHASVIDSLMSAITAANIALRDRWKRAAEEKSGVNITYDISRMVLSVVLASIFGADYDLVAPHFAVLSEDSARDLRFAQTFRGLGKLVRQVVEKRRSVNRNASDILGMLMASRNHQTGEAMAGRQLVSEIMTLIVAGHETTASTLNWVWYLLSKHSAVERNLSEALLKGDGTTCAQQIIEEALRLYPPGWLLTRRALHDDQLGPYAVPTGTEIYISPYLIQRNPALWDAPDCFDPDRFAPGRYAQRHAFAMLPFSAGPRKCIGEHLARIEMQVHVMTIAKELRLRDTGNERLELDAGVNLRSKRDFIMTPEFIQPVRIAAAAAAGNSPARAQTAG